MIDQIIEKLQWAHPQAKNIVTELSTCFGECIARKNKNGWTNCLLFVGQAFPKDNYNVTLVAACMTNPIKMNSEFKRLCGQDETQEEKPRKGRKRLLDA